jgi:SAM-dependent methyltransferase
MRCPVCSSTDSVDLLAIDGLPALCNQLCSTEDEAKSVVRGNIRLVYCPSCDHVYNREFDESRLQYDAHYENSLSCSGVFREYADDLVHQLVDHYGLRGKCVVEVGCGQGEFLKSICAAGGNKGIGFDPSYLGGVDNSRITIHAETLTGTAFDQHQDVDFVCCRHVLEHVAHPREFLLTLSSRLRTGTPVFFEVPNVLHTIRDGGVWDIIYEHFSYFSPNSLGRVFELAGLHVDEVAESFDGQFLTVHARVTRTAEEPHPGCSILRGLAHDFAASYRNKIRSWREVLRQADDAGERIVVWGAGSKGNTFANVVGRTVDAIVDINPKKHGKFVAGSGQPIIAPDRLIDHPPQLVVIMNGIYRSEIAGYLRQLGCESRLLVA